MHLFLNGLAASAGGGLTYLRNVIPHLSSRTDLRTTVAINSDLRSEFSAPRGISFLGLNVPDSALRRFCWEQMMLPGIIRSTRAAVLVSAGNFALRNSPVPQILLSRNSLYLSKNFYHDLRARGEHAMRVETRAKASLARRSVKWADCTVAPSESFARELREWTGRDIQCIYHGFDHESFFGDHSALPTEVQAKLNAAADSFRLLFVSHYNYYRNFETLFRALPLLRDRFRKNVKLLLTCRLRAGENPGSYCTNTAADLIRKLHISDMVVELGAVPYSQLHHVYKACNAYVTPAYAESFAHPLVEAMASGLPVVASEIPVHREICQEAAVYFPPFSPEILADKVAGMIASPQIADGLSHGGRLRSRNFSWGKHVTELVALAEGLLSRTSPTSQEPATGMAQVASGTCY